MSLFEVEWTQLLLKTSLVKADCKHLIIDSVEEKNKLLGRVFWLLNNDARIHGATIVVVRYTSY